MGTGGAEGRHEGGIILTLRCPARQRRASKGAGRATHPSRLASLAPQDEDNVNRVTMNRFTYHSDSIRIVFGAGSISALREEAKLHKISRLVVLCSKSRADFARRVTAPVADRCVGICDASAPNMPREAFDRIVADLKRLDADGFIVVGGGSTHRARQSRGRRHQASLHRRRHYVFGL